MVPQQPQVPQNFGQQQQINGLLNSYRSLFGRDQNLSARKLLELSRQRSPLATPPNELVNTNFGGQVSSFTPVPSRGNSQRRMLSNNNANTTSGAASMIPPVPRLRANGPDISIRSLGNTSQLN